MTAPREDVTLRAMDGRTRAARPYAAFFSIAFLLATWNAPARAQGSVFPGQLYNTGSSPRSVQIADFTGDGLPDAATADYQSNTVSVLAGDGKGQFYLTLQFSAGNGPASLAKVDFNADGAWDIACANTLSNNAILNYGPSFTQPIFLTVGTAPSSIEAGDYNNDGMTDLLTCNFGSNDVSVVLNFFGNPNITNYGAALVGPTFATAGDFDNNGTLDLLSIHTNQNHVSFWTGDGLGAFFVVNINAAGNQPSGAALDDLDGDGDLDAVVGNAAGSSILTLINSGNFIFQQQNVAAGAQPAFLTTVDANQDGTRDLAFLNRQTNQFSIIYHYSGGLFSAPLSTIVGSNPSAVAAADVNFDGAPDFIVTNAGTPSKYYNSISVFLGTPGPLVGKPSLATGGLPNALARGDWNDDGETDIGCLYSNPAGFIIYYGNGSGEFPLNATFQIAGAGATSMAAGDYNSDGRDDVAISNYNSNDIFIGIAFQNGFITFPSPAGAGGPISLTNGDYNQDGKLDLIAADAGGGSITYYQGAGDGSFAPPAALAPASAPIFVISADWNQDGIADAAAACAGSGTIQFIAGSASGPAAGPALACGGVPVSLASGSINSDASPDLAVADLTSAFIYIFTNNGNIQFTAAAPAPCGTPASAVAIGDWNQDFRSDIACALPGANQLNLMIGDGAGGIITNIAVASGAGPAALLAADFNRDGAADLVSANTNSSDCNLWLGAAPANQFIKSNATTFKPVVGLATGDLNGDGRPDAVAAGGSAIFTNFMNIFINSGGFQWKPPVLMNIAPSCTHTSLVDLNNDGRLDFVSTQFNSNIIAIYPGDGKGGFAGALTATTGNGPIAFDVLDINLDATPDLVSVNSVASNISILTNNGNAIFTAAATIAAQTGLTSVAGGDLNGDGWPDVAFTNTLFNGVAFLWSGGLLNYTLSTTTPTGPNPQSVVLSDMNADGLLDVCVANAGGGDVTILTNSGGGVFTNINSTGVHGAPVYLVIADVNSDGNLDLCTANGASATASIAYGAGAGVFTNVAQIGIGAGGSAARIAITDFDIDGDPDVITANGNLTNISLYLNKSIPKPGLQNFGMGTAGCAGTIGMNANSSPKINNNNLILTCSNAPKSAYGLGVVCDAAASVPSDSLSIGALLTIDLTAAGEFIPFDIFSDVGGTAASAPLGIPNNPLLVGSRYFAQVLFVENPSAGKACNRSSPFFVVSSRTLAIEIMP